jgi:hypothetical protein
MVQMAGHIGRFGMFTPGRLTKGDIHEGCIMMGHLSPGGRCPAMNAGRSQSIPDRFMLFNGLLTPSSFLSFSQKSRRNNRLNLFEYSVFHIFHVSVRHTKIHGGITAFIPAFTPYTGGRDVAWKGVGIGADP